MYWTSPLLYLLVLCVVLVIQPSTGDLLKIYANDVEYATDTVNFNEGTEVRVTCWYDRILYRIDNKVRLEEVGVDENELLTYTPVQGQSYGWLLSYTLPSDRAFGTHVYICLNTQISVQLSISFGRATPATTQPPSTPPHSTQTKPSTSELKPLIYTIASVVLLGTLAVVAIVTCWIRARRSFNHRVARTNNAPQDYLDYISDNDFTPLTASEFSASLQERPPTYNESQRIEDDMRQDGNDEDDNEEGEPLSSSEQPGSTTQTSPPPHPEEAPNVTPERCPSTGQETEQSSEASREREINERFERNIADIFGIEFLD